MTPADLCDVVEGTIDGLVRRDRLVLAGPRPAVRVRRSRRTTGGDYATPVALQLAAGAGLPPSGVAQLVAGELLRHPGIAEARVVPPGLVHVTLAQADASVATEIVAAGDTYGRAHLPATAPGSAVTSSFEVAPSPGSGSGAADTRRRLIDDISARLRVATGGAPPSRSTGDPGAVRLSAPSGPVDLAHVVAAAGVEAVGYELLRYPYRSVLTLDVVALTRCSVESPFYSVRYAHARAVALLRNAADLGVDAAIDPAIDDDDDAADDQGRVPRGLPTGGAALLRELTAFPLAVTSAAERREPYRLARHLEATAEVFHRFTVAALTLPRGDDGPGDTYRAAMLLTAATRVVLANGLDLLGLRAPNRL
ncbi:MAG: Arginyl-tRNA synthetase [uncultured Nocardioidaceae bacterium]|uniref:arginine--tRNA ligase n=1 Tax=uncultured Nocardioidaceae bacterium TaxID=253824 RepID=A0A6J4L6A0_9ACTN|nr:MAG: Arginyl-tRNA synthetase [uncultured Nocardioidaceae bacterium]